MSVDEQIGAGPAMAGSGERAEWSSLVDMCRGRAAREPGRKSFVFLGDGQEESDSLTLAELDRRARALAVRIGEAAAPGARAILNYGPGLDFITAFFGCLYAGVIAVPIATVDGSQKGNGQDRLRSIVDSARPELFLTSKDIGESVDPQNFAAPGVPLTVLVTDEVPIGLSDLWTMPDIGPKTIAYLQYSSGSTGLPKGVVLTHQNVLSNLALIHQNGADGATEEDPPPVVLWLPLFHDMGLVNAVLQPLYVGYDATLMAPLSFVKRPFNWLRAISRLGRAISVAPNFAYDLCVTRISAEQRAQLDLSGWSLAAVGAEPVRSDTLDRFCAVFEPHGFRRAAFFPCYGLAESTVMVSGGPSGHGPTVRTFDDEALARGRVRASQPGGRTRTLVGCGQIQPSMTVTVVDPATGEQRAGDEVGEILVAGESVGAGYWAATDLTARTFRARVSGRPDRDFLRTGDLGFLYDGQLFITGRAKDVIILDGFNHYPHDLELTASISHPLLRAGFACAFSVDDGKRERVVILVEAIRRFHGALEDPALGPDGTRATIEEVRNAVREAVSREHGVRVNEVALLHVGALPFTSSGKIQRLTCRERYVTGGFADKLIG